MPRGRTRGATAAGSIELQHEPACRLLGQLAMPVRLKLRRLSRARTTGRRTNEPAGAPGAANPKYRDAGEPQARRVVGAVPTTAWAMTLARGHHVR